MRATQRLDRTHSQKADLDFTGIPIARPLAAACLGWALCVASSVGVPVPGLAQSRGEGFLFHPPEGFVNLRFGYSVANAHSDLFSFFEHELTLEGKDWGGFSAAGNVGFQVKPRLELTFGAGYARAAPMSESREFEGEDDLPIVQTTTFERIPITVGLKFDLLSPGKTVGSLAWIPTRFVPYIAAGAGMMRYRVSQKGEFVDTETLDIFEDTFESAGWAPVAQAGVGFHFFVTPEIMLTGDWRYSWANKRPGGDFDSFHKVDLSSRALTFGIGTTF